MPFDRDVTIDFNADISGYSQSMGQMIQQTSQYSAATDGMIGKIGKLNNVILAGVKSMSAFTQTNKVATAQAAAYQQQLSKIETSAKVTGKSFKELEKTTKGLAKDFPIGMKQAVEQVEALQEAGVTSNKEISSLAKTFTKLGAATGTFGPALGKDMLQLNRTFQNGTESMEKYADSLTQVTHQYGANAGAVTSFAKAIAPVAATVGMNETSVIGLSTAFSRLGEDGYAAANTFNKVMLDMSKSIREGTPEAKIYAEVMGTTAENLKETWATNPAEGFIDFVEAIKSQGEGGIRSLEQLGLEGVRTQKTIMALANSGNMREIVATAQTSYGGGATATAAETAMGGVNDQMTMLNETMAQTAATAGKPFLGLLEKILSVANSLSKVLSDIVESDVIQGFAKLIGVVGGAAGLAKLATGLAMGGSLFGRFVRDPIRGFVGGRREGLTDPENAGFFRRYGAMSNLLIPGGAGPTGGPGLMSRAWGGARNIANVGGNLGALYFRSNANLMLERMGKEGLTTEQGARFKAATGAMGVISTTPGLSFSERRKLMDMEMGKATAALKDLSTMPGGLGRAAADYGRELRASTSYLGRVGRGAAGAVGRGLSGLGAMTGLGPMVANPYVGGAIAVAGAGYMLYKGKKQEEEAAERGGKDAYRMFNEFAEKAGIATKGLVSFAEALEESTQSIAAAAPGAGEDVYTLTTAERQQALSPGYEAAYKTRGNSFWDKLFPSDFNAEKEALRVRGMLGPNASPEALNRIQMDITAEHGETASTAVMDQLKQWEVQKLSSEELSAMLSEAGDKSRALGVVGTVESAEFNELAQAELARKEKRDIDIRGQSAVRAEEYRTAEQGLSEVQRLKTVRGDTDEENQAAFTKFMESMTLTADEQHKLTVANRQGKLDLTGDVATALRSAGLEARASAYETASGAEAVQAAGGFKNMTDEEIKALSVSAGETAAAKSQKALGDAGFTTGTLGVDLANTAKTIRDSDKTIEEWSAEVKAGTRTATDMEKAWADVKLAPGDVNAQNRLANIAAEKAIADAKAAGGGVQAAREVIQAAMTTSTGEEIPALKQAMGIIDQQAGIIDFSTSRWEREGAQIEAGKKAKAFLASPEAEGVTAEVRAAKEQEVATGTALETGRMEQVRAFQLQQRRAEEDYQKGRARMIQSYEIQMANQAEDFAKQRKYMIQDYHRSVARAEEDYYQQRMRAQRDFDKQVKRQAEETAKSMFDPYQRIGPQIVTDMAVLTQSLIEQNQSVRDQLESVDQLAAMGLSKDAIDQLKLMDPSQNQQVQRMLTDAMTNPDGINQINALIKDRLKLGTELTTSDYNKSFQNMKEDFSTSMEDMASDFEKNMKRGHQDFKRGLARNDEAFATAQSRAAEAHSLALEQMAEDNAIARTRAMEDLTGMAEEYTSEYVDIETKFLEDLANLPSNLSPVTKDAITKVLQDEIDAIEAAHTKATTKGATTASVYAMGSGGGAGGEGGVDMQGSDGPTNGVGSYSGNWQRYRSGGWHGGADIAAPAGTPTYAVAEGEVKYTKRMTTSYGIHAVLTDGKHDFLYGHMSGLNVKAGDKVSPGTQVGRVGSTGNSSGNHLHFEVRKFGMGNGEKGNVNPAPWLAEGGVVTRHIQPHIGEGGPEAVIPLNERGAQYLADAMSKASMARYWQNHEAKKTHSQQHSSPVTNNVYTYDQRTQFMGEVQVQSQDPEAMARKLAARERRNRLARKQGSAA